MLTQGLPGSKLQDLLESTPDGIVMVDSGGHIVLESRQAHKMFGYDRGELTASPSVTAVSFVCLLASSAFADEGGMIRANASSFNGWRFSQTTFCPEEPIVINISVSNSGDTEEEMRLCGAEDDRVRIRVLDSSGAVVWDTDEAKAIEEEQYRREHGHPRIYVGDSNECAHAMLEPNESAFWTSQWLQHDMKGNLVPTGQYSIAVEYRWLFRNGERQPVRATPIEVTISDAHCDGATKAVMPRQPSRPAPPLAPAY